MSFLLKYFLNISLPLIAFSILTLKIERGLAFWPWDRSILLAIHQTAQPSLDRLAPVLTTLGTWAGVVPFTVLLIVFFFLRKQWWQGWLIAIAMAGAALLSRTLKLWLHRDRPQFWELFYPLPSDYSFPSGHALFSMTFCLLLILLAWDSRWRWAVLAMGISFVVTIAWTRLYLGVHYPSDILGGWFLAIAWTSGIYGLFYLRRPGSIGESSDSPP